MIAESRDFVADFKLLHQSEEFATNVFVLVVFPDFVEVFVGEASAVFANLWGV